MLDETHCSYWCSAGCHVRWFPQIAAQDLTIVNARILDGKGGVIERGSVVVRGGSIVSVAAGAPATSSGQRIDAQGRTLMPGFIDAHRHIAQGDPAEWLAKRAPAQMQEFLDAGFTTVLCAICPDQAIELRQRIDSGTVKGPRLLVGTLIPLARPPAAAGRGGGGGRGGDPARFDKSRPPRRPTEAAGAIPAEETIKAVESVASRKYDFIKTLITVTPGGPETETLEADRHRRQEAESADDHSRGVGDRHARRRRGASRRARAHAAHRPARGRRGRGEEDRERWHPDDVDAAGVRPAFRG